MKLQNVIKIILILSMLSNNINIFCDKADLLYLNNINLIQDDKRYSIDNNTILIKKKSFKLEFELKNNGSFYINISDNPNTYNIVKNNESLLPILSKDDAWSGAEYPDNEKESFLIQEDENKWQYWFLQKDRANFDKIINKENDLYLCTRTCNNYSFIYDENYYPIEKLPYDKLFVVISEVKNDDKYNVIKIKQVKYFIIIFKNDI